MSDLSRCIYSLGLFPAGKGQGYRHRQECLCHTHCQRGMKSDTGIPACECSHYFRRQGTKDTDTDRNVCATLAA